MFAPDETWIDTFVKAMRRTMGRCFLPVNSCIETARIGVEVARTFGYIAEPVPVGVVATFGSSSVVLPGPPEIRRPARHAADGYEGHLVLWFPGDWLVDLTAPQFHHPELGVRVPEPLVLTIPRDVLASARIGGTLPTGTQIEYRELHGTVGWRLMKAWTEPVEREVRVTLEEMKRAAAATRRRR